MKMLQSREVRMVLFNDAILFAKPIAKYVSRAVCSDALTLAVETQERKSALLTIVCKSNAVDGSPILQVPNKCSNGNAACSIAFTRMSHVESLAFRGFLDLGGDILLNATETRRHCTNRVNRGADAPVEQRKYLAPRVGFGVVSFSIIDMGDIKNRCIYMVTTSSAAEKEKVGSLVVVMCWRSERERAALTHRWLCGGSG